MELAKLGELRAYLKENAAKYVESSHSHSETTQHFMFAILSLFSAPQTQTRHTAALLVSTINRTELSRVEKVRTSRHCGTQRSSLFANMRQARRLWAVKVGRGPVILHINKGFVANQVDGT